ncbi:MAG TPA: hypothetical protein VGK93_11010 [Candidatus Eisenbacteria bacterium]|jgi:hypothetical protein
MNHRTIFAALVALALAAPAAATPPAYVGAQYRYWAFDNHNDLRDVLAYWVPGWAHVQLEYWDFVNPQSDDQFRPEIGIHLRDPRRSVYTVQARHERHQDRFWLSTEQVLSRGWVGRAEISPVVNSDSTEWVVSAGADYYWGSYHFGQVTVIRDPRGDDLWVVPMRVRLATEQDDWVQVTVAPASHETIGWAMDVKKGWLRAGVERNNRFDFTTLDNVIYTVGFQVPLHPTP